MEALRAEDLGALQHAVLAWYEGHGRQLPFRATKEPYPVLVSEVMLQQTQVARVSGAWTRFLERFPSFQALADASPADVLRAWAGLGYNRRALNLRRLATTVVADHGGRLPADMAVLEKLPGIGPYTARAVAAIAFGQPAGAVDTNVRRVLGRLNGSGETTISSGEMQLIADGYVPADRPADWTHALMDIGATVCRVREPACAACPLSNWCRWARAPSNVTRSGSSRASGQAFVTTSRWLRGRILDRLRGVGGNAWVVLDEPIGLHDAAAVETALGSLEREGLLERHARHRRRVRLPTVDRRRVAVP